MFKQHNKYLATFLISVLATLTITLVIHHPADAQVNCPALRHWSSSNPPVNLRHIFCGEWRNGKPRGFHSRPKGKNPVTIAQFVVTQPENSQGIYGGRWSYRGYSHKYKFSTFFPNPCTYSQVVHSIIYAANHLTFCPEGVPNWANCGPNRPEESGVGYCQAKDDSIFTVALGLLNNGNVNTAFPLR